MSLKSSPVRVREWWNIEIVQDMFSSNKKKKIPLLSGDEVDMDLNQME